MAPEITRIESVEFSYPLDDLGTDEHGFNHVYEPGSVTERKPFAINVHTDTGITGEYVGGTSPGAAQRHCIAAPRNTNDDALALVHPDCQNVQPPVYAGGYSDVMDAMSDEDTVTPPDGAGLGVEYDWEYIEHNATGSVHVYE